MSCSKSASQCRKSSSSPPHMHDRIAAGRSCPDEALQATHACKDGESATRCRPAGPPASPCRRMQVVPANGMWSSTPAIFTGVLLSLYAHAVTQRLSMLLPPCVHPVSPCVIPPYVIKACFIIGHASAFTRILFRQGIATGHARYPENARSLPS
eukprot:365179-Chlamydomonas_euryale.AAC.2